MLDNTFLKLKNNKKLTIGYFGGSITEADTDGKSYRNLVTKWFRESYPDAEITEVNAAIAGTGSYFGVYRCDRDLLAHNPDLVFVEYCVNDSGMSYYSTIPSMETIYRKILKHNPTSDIICIITTTKDITDRIEKGIEFESRSASIAVSHHYGIPSIDVGSVMYSEILKNGGDYLQYTDDTIHPNALGHKVYADCIISHLTGYADKNSGEIKVHPLPGKMAEKTYDNACMTACCEMPEFKSDGFTFVDESLCGRYDGYMEGKNPGDSMSFAFTGDTFGFCFMMAEDSGNIIYSIDGGKESVCGTWDHFCKSFRRVSGGPVISGLEYGRHTVNIRISDQKAEESTGTVIRIGAILYS